MYGLYPALKEAVINGEYMSMREWKRLVKQSVLERDKKKIILECSLYKVLKYLKFTTYSFSIIPWWQHAFKNPAFARINRSLVRLLLNVDRSGFSLCNKCDLAEIDTIEHFMFNCPSTNNIRKNYWCQVTMVCPYSLLCEMNNMPTRDLCEFILNGFYCNYVIEWNEVYCAIAAFVYNVSTQYYETSKVVCV